MSLNQVFEFIKQNQVLAPIVTAAVLGTLGFLYRSYRKYRDGKKIYDFLLKSRTNTDFNFRSTEAISSATKIPETRVAELCSRHKKIMRNEKEKQSWQLVG